ncbi:MAG: hypothetical protein Q8O55_01895, partial [Dehalococcoidales bacterium]|nr:hypothetical protein [Dehalococcoidales bacterium]
MADQLGGGGAANIQIRELDGDSVSPVATITFHADHFTVTASAGSATDAVIALDWTNGPASRTADQTITGFWVFDNSASISGNLEVEGTASVSGAVTLNGALTSYGNNTFNGTNTFNARTDFGANASSTADFEIVGGFASSSFLYGSALSTCTASQKLQWGSGVFSCVTDQTGTSKGTSVREGTSGAFTHIGSLSFAASSFNVSTTASESVIYIDYANGPASRSIDQTISGLWTFTGGVTVSSPFEVSNTASISQLTLGNVLATTYGGTGSGSLNNLITLGTHTTGNYVATIADSGNSTITVNNSGSETAGVTLDVIDVNCTGCLGTTEIAGLDISADTNLVGGTDLTLDDDTLNLDSTLTQNFTFSATGTAINVSNHALFSYASVSNNFEVGGTASISGQATFGSNASISGNLEIGANGFVIRSAGVSSSLAFETTSYASASALWGAGLSNCGSTNKLQWDAGTFTCVEDQQGGGGGGGSAIHVREFGVFEDTSVATVSFYAPHFNVTASGSADVAVKLDWTNGPASRGADEIITGFWQFNNNVSISGNLEIISNSARAFVVSDGGGTNDTVFSIDTTATASQAGVEITAGPSQTGNLLAIRNNSEVNLARFSASGGLVINIASTSALHIQDGSANSRFIVDSTNGRVGIGTQTPSTLLEVQGTASASYGQFANTIQVGTGGLATESYNRFALADTEATNTTIIDAANDVFISGGLEVDDKAFFDATASVSGNFEVGANGFVIRSAGVSSSLPFETTSYASASALWGAGLSNCGSTNKLQWGSGTFTCVADQLGGGGAANIQIR